MFSLKQCLNLGLKLIVVWGLVLCAGQALAKEKVIIFHAGSLTVPFDEMEKNFEAMHPEIDILREGGGSTKMARMISEVGKKADIMASADYKVIDNNLIPEHADWNIRFASNQLVLCYTDKSKYAEEISSDNWYEILLREDVSWGHSDPNLDPCGYRSLMVMQLAEKFYGKEGLYEKLLANQGAIMHEGRIEQQGATQELFEKPNSPFTAQFVGMKNFFKATIHNQKAVLDHLELHLDSISENGNTYVGIRPEDILPVAAENHGQPNVFQGNLTKVVNKGFHFEIKLDVQGTRFTALWPKRTVLDLGIEPGASLPIAFPPKCLHTF